MLKRRNLFYFVEIDSDIQDVVWVKLYCLSLLSLWTFSTSLNLLEMLLVQPAASWLAVDVWLDRIAPDAFQFGCVPESVIQTVDATVYNNININKICEIKSLTYTKTYTNPLD